MVGHENRPHDRVVQTLNVLTVPMVIGVREQLRTKNLFDSGRSAGCCAERARYSRPPHRAHPHRRLQRYEPLMGCAGTRFGRNAPWPTCGDTDRAPAARRTCVWGSAHSSDTRNAHDPNHLRPRRSGAHPRILRVLSSFETSRPDVRPRRGSAAARRLRASTAVGLLPPPSRYQCPTAAPGRSHRITKASGARAMMRSRLHQYRRWYLVKTKRSDSSRVSCSFMHPRVL